MSKTLDASAFGKCLPKRTGEHCCRNSKFDVTEYSDALEQHHVNRIAALGREFGISSHAQHLSQGLPEQVIPDFAKQLDAELVVLGTIGRTGISAALLGNTAEHVLDQITDVLAIKPDDFKYTLSRLMRTVRYNPRVILTSRVNGSHNGKQQSVQF